MKRGPSLLPPHLSLHPHCILWSVLLFTCSYSPFGGDKLLFFFPRNQLLWQSLFFASKIARLRGAKEKECENMPRFAVLLCCLNEAGSVSTRLFYIFVPPTVAIRYYTESDLYLQAGQGRTKRQISTAYLKVWNQSGFTGKYPARR